MARRSSRYRTPTISELGQQYREQLKEFSPNSPEILLDDDKLAAIYILEDYRQNKIAEAGGDKNAMSQAYFHNYAGTPIYDDLKRGLQKTWYDLFKPAPAAVSSLGITAAGLLSTPVNKSVQQLWDESLVNQKAPDAPNNTLLRILEDAEEAEKKPELSDYVTRDDLLGVWNKLSPQEQQYQADGDFDTWVKGNEVGFDTLIGYGKIGLNQLPPKKNNKADLVPNAPGNEDIKNDFRKYLEPVKQDVLSPSQIRIAKSREEYVLDSTVNNPVLGAAWKWSDNWRKESYAAAQKAVRENPKLQAWALWNAEQMEKATIGDFLSSPRLIAGFVANAVPTAAAAFGTYTAGNAIMPGLGSAGAFTLMFGLEGGTQFNESEQELLDKGYSPEEARAIATGSALQTGFINAILENLRWGSLTRAMGIGKLSQKKLRDTFLDKLAKKHGGLGNAAKKLQKARDYKGLIKVIPTQALQEGMEEYLQGMNQRISELGYQDYTVSDILRGEDREGIIDFFGGFWGGGGFATGVAGIRGVGRLIGRRGETEGKEDSDVTLKEAIEEKEEFEKKQNQYWEMVNDPETAFTIGEMEGSKIQELFSGGPNNLSWQQYLGGYFGTGGSYFPTWNRGDKPPDDASEASKAAYEHGKKNLPPGARLLKSMIKSKKGRGLFNEHDDALKLEMESELRSFFRSQFKWQLGDTVNVDSGLVDDVIDKVLEYYIVGNKTGISLEALTEEEKKIASSIILPEDSFKLSDKLVFHKGSEDVLKQLEEKLINRGFATEAALRKSLEDGSILQEEFERKISDIGNVRKFLTSKLIVPGKNLPERLQKSMFEKKFSIEGLMERFQADFFKKLEEKYKKKAAEQQNKKTEGQGGSETVASESQETAEWDYLTGTFDASQVQNPSQEMRGIFGKFLQKNNNDVDALSKELSKKKIDTLKEVINAYSYTIKPGQNELYPTDDKGNVIIGGNKKGGIKKSDLVEQLAEDIVISHTKMQKKADSGETNAKVIAEQAFKKKKNTTEDKIKNEGGIISDGNAVDVHQKFVQKYASLAPIAEVASYVTSTKQFKASLKKLGVSDELMPQIIKSIKGMYPNAKDPIYALITDAKESILQIKKDATDVPEYWQEWRDKIILGVNATIELLGGTKEDGDGIIIGAMTNESWKFYKNDFDMVWTEYMNLFQEKETGVDESFLFKTFIRGGRKGILKSDTQYKQIIKDWFVQWAINHPLGQGQSDLFGDEKILGIIPTFKGFNRALKNEAVRRGGSLAYRMENQDRESLDNIESDIRDDRVNGFDYVSEDLYSIVTTNMQRFLETSLLRRMTTDDLVVIQEAAYAAEDFSDFMDFFLNNDATEHEGAYSLTEEQFEEGYENLLIKYYNSMKSRIPRDERMYFVLSNVDTEGNIGTGQNPKLHLRLKTQDWKNRKKLSGFIAKNFLDESDIGNRTALLYASDVLRVYKTKKGKQGDVFDEETGLADMEKLWAKNEPGQIDKLTINNLEIDLGNQWQSFGADNIMFIVGMKAGNSRAMIIGMVEDWMGETGLNVEKRDAYFKKEIADNRLTESQYNNMKSYADRVQIINPSVWSQVIGRHEYWKTAFHNYYLRKNVPDADLVNNKNFIKWMFNRMRIVLSEGMSTYDAGPSTHITIDPSRTKMFYKGQELVSWGDFLSEGINRYGFDGVIFDSNDWLKKLEHSSGMIGAEMGWAKTYISESSGDGADFIGIKGLETRAIDGLEWRDSDGNIVAKAIETESRFGGKGVNLVDKNGDYIDKLISTEESKIGTAGVGKYNKLNEPVKLGPGATKILQVPGSHSKDSAAAPFQWLDNMLDPELMKDPVAKEAYSILTKHFMKRSTSHLDELVNLRKHPKRVYHWLKRVSRKKTFNKPEMQKWLDTLNEDSSPLLAHDHFVTMYEPMAKNRLVVDGAFKGRNVGFGSYLHIRPNMRGDVSEWEGVVSVKDKSSWNKFKKLYVDSLRSSREKARFRRKPLNEKVEIVNEWLENDPTDEHERWFLNYRIPINGITAVNLDRLKRFSSKETGDTAQFHIKNVFGIKLGDWDGDTVQIYWLPEEETKVLMKFGRKYLGEGKWGLSDLYEKLHSVPKLDLYADSPVSQLDLSNFDAVVDGIVENYQNSMAVGLVSNVVSLRGTLSIKEFGVTVRKKGKEDAEITYSIIHPSDMVDTDFILKESVTEDLLNSNEEIYVKKRTGRLKGETVTKEYRMHRMPSRNHLQVILQAALDDVKYSLLNLWGFDGPNFMMKQIFKRSDGKKLSDDEAGWLWAFVQPYFNYSRVRQGFTPSRRKASMHQVMARYDKLGRIIVGSRGMSGGIMKLKNMKSEELAEFMKNKENLSKKKPGAFRQFVTKVHIKNVTTHMEHLLSHPMEHFDSHFDRNKVHPTYLRRAANAQTNAHIKTMEILSEKLDEFRAPGTVFDGGISQEDEASGNEFFRKMVLDFYKIFDKMKTVSQAVNRDTTFSMAAFEYDEEFISMQDKWVAEFDELTPQAQFVSTFNFLQGLSSPDQKAWSPESKRKIAEMAAHSNTLDDRRMHLLQSLKTLRKRYKDTESAIEQGILKPTVQKPNKEGRMFMTFTGYQRKGLKANNTFDAVLSGEKTSTTRFNQKYIDYWNDLKVGDIIKFKGPAKDKIVYVQVTHSPEPVNFSDMSDTQLEEWSKTEGWSVERALQHKKDGKKGIQFHFKVFKRSETPGALNTLGVVKIISGGQNGADLAGVKAGLDLGLQTGGNMPKGYRTTDLSLDDARSGVIDKLGEATAKKYGLTAMESAGYPTRTMKNVKDAHRVGGGTIAFRFQKSPGTDKTIGFIRNGKWEVGAPQSSDTNVNGPLLVITDPENSLENREKIRNFILRNGIRTVNIAGHGEKSFPGMEGLVYDILTDVFHDEATAGLPSINKLDTIQREAETIKMKLAELDKNKALVQQRMATFKDIKTEKVSITKRNIFRLLPHDLFSKDLANIFGKEFGNHIKDEVLDYSKPLDSFLITYGKNFDTRLTVDLDEKGKC